MKNILVTGGLGYIGSHTIVQLIKNGYNVITIDNLSNSSVDVIDKIQEITGVKIKFYKGDIRERSCLEGIFENEDIYGVIHFAGKKAVGESCEKPLIYYDNNISGTLVLLEVMKQYKVKNLIFSSSATVYGEPKSLPIKEDFERSANNPYGRSKLILEDILFDLAESDKEWNIVILRYFNPIGADKSGLIGENPNGIPNNLLPYVAMVANGELERLSVFGGDYDTNDGTGVRDYIHVVDLAIGHIKSIKKFEEESKVRIYNLGTGIGYSVLEIINTFKEVSGKEIPYSIVERRAGDIASCYADSNKSKEELGFRAKNNLEDMIKDTWNYQMNKK